MTAPGEVITPLLVLEQDETHTADEDWALVITGEHTHSDILRYVVSEIGSDARSLLEAALTGEDTAGSPTNQNTEPGLAFSDAGEP
jgi:hypothetical protein